MLNCWISLRIVNSHNHYHLITGMFYPFTLVQKLSLLAGKMLLIMFIHVGRDQDSLFLVAMLGIVVAS